MSRTPTEPYSRLYHKLAREYPTIYADDAAFAAFGRLLMVADAAWPMRPPLPRAVRPRALRMLVEAGLVIPDGVAYTIRGLDAERARRRDAGRTGAAVRWDSERIADGNANAMPNRVENETRREDPPTPLRRGRRANGTNERALEARRLVAARREANEARQLLSAHNNGAHADEADARCGYCRERSAAYA